MDQGGGTKNSRGGKRRSGEVTRKKKTEGGKEEIKRPGIGFLTVSETCNSRARRHRESERRGKNNQKWGWCWRGVTIQKIRAAGSDELRLSGRRDNQLQNNLREKKKKGHRTREDRDTNSPERENKKFTKNPDESPMRASAGGIKTKGEQGKPKRNEKTCEDGWALRFELERGRDNSARAARSGGKSKEKGGGERKKHASQWAQ